MEEKEQPTAEVGTEEVANQPEGEVKPQPTVEELQQQVDEKNAEIARKEEVIKQTKADKKRLERMGGSTEKVDALSKELREFQEFMAGALDEVVSQREGYEEEPRRKPSYKEQLKARQESKPKQEIDPAAQRFFDYLSDEGLDFDDDMVQDTIKDTKTPQEALKAVKEKVKTMEQSKIEELAEKKAQEKVATEVQKALKDGGYTAVGVENPSAPSGRNFTISQINSMSSKEYAEREDEILEAQRQGRIIDK